MIKSIDSTHMMQRYFGWFRQLAAGAAVLSLFVLPVWSAANHYLPQALVGGSLVHRWNDETPTIYINIQSARQMPGWSDKHIDTVKLAFTEWERALGGKLTFVYTPDQTRTDVTVKWRPRASGTEVGLQRTQSDYNNRFTDADIELALADARGTVFTPDMLYSTTLHEIGHMLGIRGHSPHASDIMYASMQPDVNHLSPRDIATMRQLYDMPPDITNPKGIHLLKYRQFHYYIDLGIKAHQQKRSGDAYGYFTQARDYYPHDERIDFFLGMSAYHDKAYDQALKSLERAVMRKNEDNAHARFLLAASYMMVGTDALKADQVDKAKACFKQAHAYYRSVHHGPDAAADTREMAADHLSKVDQIREQLQ